MDTCYLPVPTGGKLVLLPKVVGDEYVPLPALSGCRGIPLPASTGCGGMSLSALVRNNGDGLLLASVQVVLFAVVANGISIQPCTGR